MTITARTVRTVALLALTAGAIALPRALLAQDMGIKVGSAAPPAAVASLDGTAMDLLDMYRDKPVVLEFWATWCPLCRKLEPAIEAARTRYAGTVTFIRVGVSANQSPERQRAYADKQKLTGEFVFDRNGAATRAFAVPHTSYIVMIDRNRRVVYTGVGADQDVDAAVQRATGSN